MAETYADTGTPVRSGNTNRYRPMAPDELRRVLAEGKIPDSRLLRSYGTRVRAHSPAVGQRARQTQDDPEMGRRGSQQLSHRRSLQDQRDEEDEQEKEQDHKRTRKLSSQPHRRSGKHPLFWCGLTFLLMVLFWIGSTNGASWYTSHLTDPGTYGPTQGTIVLGVFGGGDNPEKPTKLIALNNDGQIQLIKVTANDPVKGAQLVTGPNLVKQGFPDPTRAKVDLQVGDFDRDGKQDVKVTVFATMFDFPFHRYQQAIILYGDGKGGLRPRQS